MAIKMVLETWKNISSLAKWWFYQLHLYGGILQKVSRRPLFAVSIRVKRGHVTSENAAL